uniref:Uncharacterized protein n=1 Tax=Leersia perrieri TaxID=77586 RepID=A0A0D9V570_9ORYZ
MATGEELYESEVLFPDHHDQACHRDVPSPPARMPPAARRGQISHPATAISRPVDIPTAAVRRWSGVDLQADDVGTMVPPHLMVSRRRSEGEAAAFSLRSGTGRPARRDLSHLRNSVLRMTGFIEG